MPTIIPLTPAASLPEPRTPKPSWLKVRAPGSPSYLRLKALMRGLDLHTVCEEARCPNIGECWNHGTATFMILGDVCTRACGYCAVAHGTAGDARSRRAGARRRRDQDARPAATSSSRRSIATTSTDGGAGIFAETIRADARAACRRCRIEVLIPDFQGNEAPLRTVLDAGPDVLNHNTETVPRLYRMARSGGTLPAHAGAARRARAPTRRTSRPRPA